MSSHLRTSIARSTSSTFVQAQRRNSRCCLQSPKTQVICGRKTKTASTNPSRSSWNWNKSQLVSLQSPVQITKEKKVHTMHPTWRCWVQMCHAKAVASASRISRRCVSRTQQKAQRRSKITNQQPRMCCSWTSNDWSFDICSRTFILLKGSTFIIVWESGNINYKMEFNKSSEGTALNYVFLFGDLRERSVATSPSSLARPTLFRPYWMMPAGTTHPSRNSKTSKFWKLSRTGSAANWELTSRNFGNSASEKLVPPIDQRHASVS